MLVEKSNILEVADVTFHMEYRTLMIKKRIKYRFSDIHFYGLIFSNQL